VPVIASTGIGIRNAADKFTSLKLTGQNDLPQRSEILDRDGHLITYVYGVDLGKKVSYSGLNRQPVAFKQIAPAMQNAIVGIEDDRYWEHGAIDVKGTLRALVNDLRHQPVQGGSSIAQQYVKNVLLLSALHNSKAATAATEDTLSRKLNELRMAVDVEHQMTKQNILAGYLNDAFFGNGAYGIEAAAETYFDTTASKLTLTQAALLAGIVENPTQYNPIRHPKDALTRRNVVLDRMWQTDNGLTQAQAAAAKKKPLGLKAGQAQNGCTASSVGNASYFCDYVMHVLTQDPTLGSTPQDRAQLLATGGLHIYTTLSEQDQHAATEAVNYVVPEHSRVYNPGHNADTEVVVQPGTGQVMAIAEDRPYGTGRNDTEVDYGVNTPFGGEEGVQTGSSSKLFTLVTALEQGISLRLHRHGEACHDGFRVHELRGTTGRKFPGIRAAACLERGEFLGRRSGDVLPLHGHHGLDQHVLRAAGAEGRPVQRRAHRGGDGDDVGQRCFAAEGGPQPRLQRLG
jgi:membrane peptidoglycan carboxypeptidase